MAPLVETKKNHSAPKDILFLKRAFSQFEENAKRLEKAYSQMQKDFRSLNLELDAKNEELKETLEETRTVRERLNCVLQSLKSGVIVTDVKGHISHFNRTAEIVGIKAENALGKPYADAVKHAAQVRGLLHTLKTGEEVHNEDREIESLSGETIPVNYSSSLVKDDGGIVMGAVEVFQDISELKAMEQEVQRARTLAALGEMSATVAHEIRNPLGGIGTYAALLERDLDKDDPRRKLVKRILQGITSLNKIVTNLLVYTRPMRGGFQQIPLNGLIREISDFAMLEIQNQGKVPITLTYKIPKRDLVARVDPEKMQQLLLNLFFNAAQAMPEGGTITLTLRRTTKPPPPPADSGVKSWHCIQMRDTGTGISDEALDKVFSPFYTTRENGTGLGLAIVRKIAEFHKGCICAKSKEGKGTTFEVYLPAASV